MDEWVDRFVKCVNRLEREPKMGSDVPERLRVARLATPGALHMGNGWYDWQMRQTDSTPWIDALEARIPHAFPPSFRSLVRRYIYPDFSAASIWLFSNTGEPLAHELSNILRVDLRLEVVMARQGYVQFARPETGSYDPVCFDTRSRARDGECPIVPVEHEAILCHDRIGKTWEIAPSFLEFIREFVEHAEAGANG